MILVQSLLANLRTLCPQQNCVTKQENVTKRHVANITTILDVFLCFINKHYFV